MGFSKWIAHDGDRTAQKFGWLHMVTESPAGFNHVRSTATTAAAISSNSSNKRNNRNKHFRESCVCQQVEQMSIAKKHGPKLNVLFFLYNIYGCVFFRCADFSKGGKFEFCEPYPRIIPRTIPRIIPANHTPKNHDYECFFWDRLGLHGLTSFNGRDKPIDKCWPDPMIPGCLHIPSRHEW